MLWRLLLCCSLAAFSTAAWSQDAPSRIEVFGGFSYTPTSFSFMNNSESGWTAGACANANRWIGFKADVAQYLTATTPSDHSTTTTFLFGPQVSIPLAAASRLRPFGEFLIGGAHIHYTTTFTFPFFQQSTSFAWAVGGGLDFRLSSHFWLRGEGDYLHDHFITSDNQLQSRVSNTHVRMVTGLVFRL